MILLCFSGFLRFNELSNLLCSDLKICDSYLVLKIRKSKTDQYRHGDEVVISKGQTVACPLTMIRKYIEIAEINLDDNAFLFKPIFRSGSTCKLIHKNKCLSYTGTRQAILKRLSLVCDVKNVGLHSLRAGGATVAANNGVNDRCFKRHGRWKSEACKDGYVADSLQSRLSVTQKLGL
ncbi:integrase/recombinase xerD homolog [Argopecten irradians]|uniref:integrase/recombinase xerD homolog n=1 Tax=Argopecten irradians TaxID=31199 RepID=UPI00371D186A